MTHVRQGVEKPRQEETTRHSLACFAARSAALDLAGVPAKIEHRGQHKSVYGHGVSGLKLDSARTRGNTARRTTATQLW